MKPNYKFRPTGTSTNVRHRQSIINFSGVDFATQKFKISKEHAIDINNFIYRDGVIQKRFGYEELIEIPSFYYVPLGTKDYKVNPKNVNGLWHFLAEDNKEHIIAHIGHLLFEVVDFKELKVLGSTSNKYTYETNVYREVQEFENYKSSAFIGANRFYFLGGNKYMCLRFLNGGIVKFYEVAEHEDTYIPTTTISITYKNSGIAQRHNLDKTNLLTMYRINELLSGTLKQEDEKTKTDFFEYTLDAPVIVRDKKDFSKVRIIIKERGKIK